MEGKNDDRVRVIGVMANRRQLGVTFADERMTILRWEDVLPKDQEIDVLPVVSVTEDGEVGVWIGETYLEIHGGIIRAANDPSFASEIGVLPIKRD